MNNEILKREVPRFLLSLLNYPSPEKLQEYVNFVTQDQYHYAEFVIFTDLLDRKSNRFQIISNYHMKTVNDINGQSHLRYIEIVEYLKTHKDILSLLPEEVRELYSKETYHKGRELTLIEGTNGPEVLDEEIHYE